MCLIFGDRYNQVYERLSASHSDGEQVYVALNLDLPTEAKTNMKQYTVVQSGRGHLAPLARRATSRHVTSRTSRPRRAPPPPAWTTPCSGTTYHTFAFPNDNECQTKKKHAGLPRRSRWFFVAGWQRRAGARWPDARTVRAAPIGRVRRRPSRRAPRPANRGRPRAPPTARGPVARAARQSRSAPPLRHLCRVVTTGIMGI